jgi:hypothetical protein
MPQAELPDYVSQQRIEEQELESKSPPSAKKRKGQATGNCVGASAVRRPRRRYARCLRHAHCSLDGVGALCPFRVNGSHHVVIFARVHIAVRVARSCNHAAV